MKRPPKFITIKLIALLGNVSLSTAWRYTKRPDFPKPRYFSAGKLMWIEEEVLAWFMSRPHTRTA